MQQFVEYIAILAFVVVYFVTRDIFIATAVLMVGVTAQIILYWAMKKPITGTIKVTFWVSMVMGGLTLFFQDETFIKWKPTIAYWLMAAALLGGHWFGRTYFLQKILGAALTLPDANWRVLTYGWAFAFAISGVINIWVAYSFSLDTWVTFKLIGGIGLNIVFMLIMFGYLYSQGLLNEDTLKDPNATSESKS